MANQVYWNYPPRGLRNYDKYSRNTALGALALGAMGGMYKARQSSRRQSAKSKPSAKVQVKITPSRRKSRSGVKDCKKAIRKLQKQTDASTGTMVFRQHNASAIISSANLTNQGLYGCLSTASIESALSNLKYYDPSTPGTLITASASSGTYQRNFLIEQAYMSLDIRNNYQSDVRVLVYLCKVKDDTDQTALQAWTAGIADGGNATAITQPNQYPTDYNLVKDLYSLKRLKDVQLRAGQHCSVSHCERNIEYDSSTVDTHNLSYQKEYKAFQFLVVVQGVIAHDGSLSQYGLIGAGVDIENKLRYKVVYNAGVNIDYIHLDNNLQTFTNGAVQSNKPANTNQGWSL